MNDRMRTHLRLLTLVVLAFLPAVVLYLYANSTLRSHERESQEQELLHFSHVAGVEYQRLLDNSRELLASLIEFPEIRDGVRPDCGERLSSVLRHTPQYTTLSLIGRDGYLECGSLTVDGGLYLGDRAYYLLATTNNRFSVGDYALGRITGKPTVGVGMPIQEGDLRQVSKVLAASLDLTTLGSNASRIRLPDQATFTVVDRHGNVLVRDPAGKHPLGYDTVGAQVPETFPELPPGVSDPLLVAGTDLDGVDRLFAVAPLSAGGTMAEGYLLVGKEEAMLLTEAEVVAARELQFLGIAGVFLLLLTWLFGHFGLVRVAEDAQA